MAIVEKTKDRALREAKELLQTFGFHGFSFQDVADRVGIQKASLYDHFDCKDTLGRELIDNYHESFRQWTHTIEIFDTQAKVGALFELFFKFSGELGKICPLSALILDFNSLSKKMQSSLLKMFQTQMAWMEKMIKEGQKEKIFRRDFKAGELAQMVISLALGAQLTARVTKKPEQIRSLKKQMLKILQK